MKTTLDLLVAPLNIVRLIINMVFVDACREETNMTTIMFNVTGPSDGTTGPSLPCVLYR